MSKLISIIIPVKNGQNYIREAIVGIRKQDMNVEIIVIDDASNDDTVKIVQSMGCTVIKHETNRGQVAGKNTGIKVAKGKYIMFHDHDDVMNEGALRTLYDANADVVMAKIKDFMSPDCIDNAALIQSEPYYGLFTGAVLIKKEVFDKVGLFREDINAGEIIEFDNKLREQNIEIKKIDFISTNRRIHNTNFGKTNQQKEYKDYASILRARMGKKS